MRLSPRAERTAPQLCVRGESRAWEDSSEAGRGRVPAALGKALTSRGTQFLLADPSVGGSVQMCVNALGAGGGGTSLLFLPLLLLLCNLGHQCACPSRAPGGGRGVVCSDKGPPGSQTGWQGHHRVIRGCRNSQGSRENNDAACSFLLPEITDGKGRVGRGAGVPLQVSCPCACLLSDSGWVSWESLA